MTGTSNASTQAQQQAIPNVQHRIILAENVRLDDPQLRESVTDQTVVVLARWIKDLIGVDIKPDTLGVLLNNLPLMGSVFSAFDVVDDIKNLATYNAGTKLWGYETFQPWMETGLDLIGVLGLPPFKQASMGLKTAIRMTFDPKYMMAHAKDNAASFMNGSTIVMLEEVANTHLRKWQPDINKGVDRVIGGTITTVESIARLPQARALSAVYTTFSRRKDPAEEIKELLNEVQKASKGRIDEVIGTLIPLILTFTKQHKSGHSKKSQGDIAKQKRTAENESSTKHRNGAPNQVNKHEIEQTPGITTKAQTNGQQNPTAGPDCKSCKTANPVNLATGEEILYQTDFATPGLIPVSWTRCYRSSHAPYDKGSLGARWTSPYTTAITQSAEGLVYHDPTGRNIRLPLIGIGEAFDDLFEAFTIARTSATELVIAYRSGATDVFHAVGQTGPQSGAAAGLRYALRAKRTAAGPALYILPAQEARTQFRDHPAAKRLSPDALLVVTDGHALWLECRPATADNFAADSPAARKAISDLAAVHVADQKAGIAIIAGDTAFHPAAYANQLSQCIGTVDQLLADGSRHTHVRYRYAPALDEHGTPLGADAGLDLIEQIDAQDNPRSYAYASHLLTRYTDYNGFGQNLTWEHSPDWAPFATRCVRTVADDGTEDTRLSYDTRFNETTLIDAAGNRSVYTYNGDNLVTGIATTVADGSQPFQQRVWDKNGNLTKEIDPEGRTTRYTYDDKGRLLSVVAPSGTIVRYEYDASGSPAKITDPAGRSWQRNFDANGNLTVQTDPAGRTTAYKYNGYGQLVEIQDAKGGTEKFSYDDLGQLVSSTDCSGRTTRFSYNQLGHLIAGTDAAQHVTRYDTDKLGRIKTVTHPDGSQESYTYDANDNVVSVTDQNGKTSRFAYNGQGLLTSRIDANGNSLAYRYNANLQLLKLINQNGESYDFAYDAQRRLVSETGFDGKQTSYRYDLGGELIASESGRTRTEYERDDAGNLLTKRVHQSGGNGPITETTRYQYDVLGKLLSVKNRDSEIQFGYDDAGNLVEETQHVMLRQGGKTLERVFTLKHEVDELGNRIETILPNGRKITTQRYGSGHWIGTLWNGSPIADIERDDLHREKTRQMGRVTPQRQDRLTQTRHYDPLSRLLSLKLHSGQEVVAARSMHYDAAGNLNQIEDWKRDKISYEYDPVGQLLRAIQPGLVESFAFDPAGNLTDGSERTRRQINKAGIDHGHWDQGLEHMTEQPVGEPRPKIASITHNLLRCYLGMEFDYDAEGNTIRKIVKGKENEPPYSLTLHYDAENRLVKAIKPQAGQTMEAEYRYDAFGRRIAKVVRTLREAKATGTYGGSGRMETVQEDITFFVWDGDTLIQEVKPDTTITYLYEPDSFVPLARVHSDMRDSAYDPEVTKKKRAEDEQNQAAEEQEAENLKWLKVTDKAAYESAVKAIEARKLAERQEEFAQLEAQARNDQIYYVNADHLGTPQEVVSEDGKVVWLARFKAWGRIHKLDKEDVQQPFRFQGQYEDVETGLFYNRHRYYDPDTARYLTQDPIGLLGGTNPFSYAPNPTNWTDALGLKRKGGRGNERGPQNATSGVTCPTSCSNPCAGKNPAAWASQWQGHGDYQGKDVYTNTVLKEGTIIYGGAPGQSAFYVDEATLNASNGSKAKLWQSVQVLPHPKKGYRSAVQAYRVKKDTCAAVGVASAQTSTPEKNFGPGGGTQYYLSDYKTKLEKVGPTIALK